MKKEILILKPENVIARVLHVVGIIQIIGGVLLGIYLGQMNIGILVGTSGFSWSLFLFVLFNGVTSGLIFIAAGEGVRLLAVMVNRITELDFNVKRIKDKHYEQS